MKKLSKTNFHDYRACSKCFWLRHNRPDAIVWPSVGAQAQTRMREGQQVEKLSGDFVRSLFGESQIRPQVTFQTNELIARADFVRDAGTGLIDIIEVKASTKVKEGNGQDHVVDAAFQLLVAERDGWAVDRVFLVHLNGDYCRSGNLAVDGLFVAVDLTQKVRERQAQLAHEIDTAAAFLVSPQIDESGCDCRFSGVNKRCDAFAHFNPGIPADSVHHLPRISSAKLRKFEGMFGLDVIDADELSPPQRLVHRSFLEGPVIDRAGLRSFLQTMRRPLYFYDYETTGPAIPPVDGYRPYQALPVQFSLHRMDMNGTTEHFEWIADDHGQQLQLIERLEELIADEGALVSWNKGFENGCNKRMSELYPEKAAFLLDLNRRTVDLEDPFKKHYVHWGFRGSTSIKRVLPVMCPELSYSTDEVHDGTGAVEAWCRMIESNDPVERTDLRRQLLGYCKLDSLAMVRIYEALNRTLSTVEDS